MHCIANVLTERIKSRGREPKLYKEEAISLDKSIIVKNLRIILIPRTTYRPSSYIAHKSLNRIMAKLKKEERKQKSVIQPRVSSKTLNKEIVRVHGKKKNIKKRKQKETKEERADRVRWKDSVCSVTSSGFYTRPVYTTIPLTHSTLVVSRLQATFLSSVRSPSNCTSSAPCAIVFFSSVPCKRVFSNRESTGEVTLNRSSRTSLDFQAPRKHGELFSGCVRIDALTTCYYSFDQVYCRPDNATPLCLHESPVVA